MCANCGLPSAPGHWTDAGLASPHERVRARLRRARLLQSVLSAYGLSAHDDAVMPGLMIATKTGHHELVADLAELWSAAERMSGRTIDPLDPRFIGEGEIS
jgi:hypothetical protein